MPYTGDQKRAYAREWMARRRAAFFDGRSCVKCGSTESLELDHIDRSVKWTHRIWSYSEEKRMVELAKCQILCHDCHLAKTIQENEREFCYKGHPLDGIDRRKGRVNKRCLICHRERRRKPSARHSGMADSDT